MSIRKTLSLLALFALVQCSPKTGQETPVTDNGLSISYIAHACFILESNGTSIMLDPYADRVWLGYDFPRGLKPDAVFITHPHYDHDGGIFRGMRPDWMLNASFYQHPKAYEVGDFSIDGLIGKHCDPYGKEFGQMNTIWKIEVNGLVIAHWGDNALPSEANFKALEDVDILFIPMDGVYHILSPEEYREIFTRLAPDIIIPMHYRIAALEHHPDSPSDLGEIDPFLEERPPIAVDSMNTYIPEVIRLNSNRLDLDDHVFSDKSKYVIFEHSPLVRRPESVDQ